MDQTYPRHVHQRGGVYRIVTTDAEWTAALGDGWVEYPRPEWGVPDVYREWDGSPIEASPAEPSRGRGRRRAE